MNIIMLCMYELGQLIPLAQVVRALAYPSESPWCWRGFFFLWILFQSEKKSLLQPSRCYHCSYKPIQHAHYQGELFSAHALAIEYVMLIWHTEDSFRL